LGLISAIRKFFGGVKDRDVSGLAREAESAESLDAVQEVVDLSGGPLKEGHLRRALRDKAFLPKAKSIGRTLGVTKRKLWMPRQDADRMFGGTHRTRNRRIRDLLADKKQLERLGLPIWETEADLASSLGITTKMLYFFSIHREKERQPHYVTFAIPKRSGGKRLIMAPKRRLKAIQRNLVTLLIEKLTVNEIAHGFRKGRNIRTGAEPHVGKRILLHIDLKDFFPTVTFARVRGLLISYGYGYRVATTLAVLMTEAERQPVELDGTIFHVPVGDRHCVQGAPTSPGICNAILLRLDRRLNGLAKKRGLVYTRYADDLSFSGDQDVDAIHRFRVAASKLIEAEGFQVNRDKVRVMKSSTRQSVTGVVVNKTLGLSRQERRKLRAMAHQLSKKAQSSPLLEGKIAYLHMLNPGQAEILRKRQSI
jgi:RNA-directed DNA polymerase